MKLYKSLITTLMTCLITATNAQAFEVFKAEDINSGGLNTHVSPNLTAQKESEFLTHLHGVSTEEFETIAWISGTDLNLSFTGAGTATLGGGGELRNIQNRDNVISNQDVDFDFQQGLYPVSGNKYWRVGVNSNQSNSFTINFTENIAAFGFYVYDLGDWGAKLTLNLYSGDQLVGTISDLHSVKTDGSTTGSVIYTGVKGEQQADGSYQTFNRVEFVVAATNNTSNTSNSIGLDIIAFDNMTIGTVEQLVTEPEPSPEVVYAD